MRRRLAESLAVLLSIASLGVGAASGPSSLEAAKVIQPPVVDIATVGHNTRKSKAYQVGTASWYGEQFQGKQTASGEPFDMRDFTAAHPSLPLGTFVKRSTWPFAVSAFFCQISLTLRSAAKSLSF